MGGGVRRQCRDQEEVGLPVIGRLRGGKQRCYCNVVPLPVRYGPAGGRPGALPLLTTPGGR